MQECEYSGNDTQHGWMLLFAGQGNPLIGMGKEVCDNSPVTRQVWDCASDISGIDMRSVCHKGPMTKLSQTRYQQLAVNVINIAMLLQLRQQAPQQEIAFAGHSAGEYSALFAAGVMDMPTLFTAVNQRACIMQNLAEQHKGTMYAVKGLSLTQVQQQIDSLQLNTLINIGCDNSSHQQVISGCAKAIRGLNQALLRSGAQTFKLAVNGAWHSPLMAAGVPLMREALAKLHFVTPRQPVKMNISASPEQDVASIKENLAQHLVARVRWRESLDARLLRGQQHFLEIGHKKVLGGLLPKQNIVLRHFHDLAAARATSSLGA